MGAGPTSPRRVVELSPLQVARPSMGPGAWNRASVLLLLRVRCLVSCVSRSLVHQHNLWMMRPGGMALRVSLPYSAGHPHRRWPPVFNKCAPGHTAAARIHAIPGALLLRWYILETPPTNA